MADAFEVDPEELESEDEEVDLLDEDVEDGARQGDAEEEETRRVLRPRLLPQPIATQERLATRARERESTIS